MCFSGFVAKCSAKWRIFVCLTTFNSSGYSPIMKELVYLSIREKFFLAGIHMMGNNLTLLDELIWVLSLCCWIIHISVSWWTLNDLIQTEWKGSDHTVPSQLTHQITLANTLYTTKCNNGTWRNIRLYAVLFFFFKLLWYKQSVGLKKRIRISVQWIICQTLWLYSLFSWECMFPPWPSLNSDQYIWRT